MQVWCQGCNEWYDTDMRASECPFCYTFNYISIEEKRMEELNGNESTS
jgi:Zn finger protein HypA/HybF involved in hydrogenase expression